MSQPFVPQGFVAPEALVRPGFRLEPLGAQHNERDYDAWMSSIDHIRATPGFADRSWPSPMSLEENLADLVRHADDFEQRKGFTYSVLDGDDVIGCVYIYPSKENAEAAAVSSWVRESRSELDVALYHAVKSWLEADWPFPSFDYSDRA